MSMASDIRRALDKIKKIAPSLTPEQLREIEKVLDDTWRNGRSYVASMDSD